MSIYGLIIGIACVVFIQYFTVHNKTVPKDKKNIFILGLLLFSLIGARTYHVIDQWSYYSQNPAQILNTRAGGLGIYGVIIAAIVFSFLFSKFYKISFLKIVNTIAPSIPLCQSIGRLGNFFNHEIPIWWLESFLCLVLFLYIQKFPKNPFAKYLIGYGSIRLLTETFRSDTWAVNNFKIAHLISFILITAGLLLIHHEYQRVKISKNHPR